MRYLTDQLLESYGSLDGVPLDERAQAITDADAVYEYLRRAEGQLERPVDDERLRKWGEANEIGPDRLNASLALLAEQRRVFAVPGADTGGE